MVQFVFHVRLHHNVNILAVSICDQFLSINFHLRKKLDEKHASAKEVDKKQIDMAVEKTRIQLPMMLSAKW